MLFSATFSPVNSQARTTVKMPVLKGVEAISHLKEKGAFKSLSAAYQTAQYSIDENITGATASNPVNSLQMKFTDKGLQLSSTAKEKNWTSNWSLSSFGYGADQTLISKGDLQTSGNRVELKRDAQNLTEWFVNETNGVEHGFMLAERPAGTLNDEALRLVMKVDGDLTARADADGQMLTLLNNSDEKILRYEKLKVWDANGTDLIARMRTDESVGEVWYEVEDESAVYPLTIDPTFVNEAIITASDGSTQSAFGSGVAISGDTVIVGSEGDNSNRGAAYIFVKNGKGWTQQQKLTASNGAANDGFGWSVGISGDTAIIGAYDVTFHRGAAYIFVRNGTTWTQQQKLIGSGVTDGDDYGYSVGISGDTAIVGARGDNSNGAAHVFNRIGTNWTQQQKLTAPNAPFAQFGSSVSINGNTLIVGARSDRNDSNNSQGSAYIFVRNGTNWSLQQKLIASDVAVFDLFGHSVGINEDTVIVGAYSKDIGSNSSQGAAYIFVRNGTNWTQQQRLTASDGASQDWFGYSVAISGNTAIVGVYRDDNSQGSAYIYSRNGTNWSQDQKLSKPDAFENDRFGWSVAVESDTIIVGVRYDNIGSNVNQGSAYIYGMPSITVNITTDESDPTPADGDCDVDSGTIGQQCSLRAAIETANANAGADKIEFDIAGGGIQTIAPLSSLPVITGTTQIDGKTQPGYISSPVIEIRGDTAGAGADGLIFDTGSDDSTVSGLAISRFFFNVGFLSNNNKIESCYIGLDANGLATDTQRRGFGIAIGDGTNGNSIGGVNNLSKNIISNTDVGILIFNASENIVLGNRIGTNPDGTAAIPNQTGISLRSASLNTIGDPMTNSNLISGNDFNIRLEDDSTNNRIVGNNIGTKLNGTDTLPGDYGIVIDTGATGNVIEDNVIGGNDGVNDAGIIFQTSAGSGNLVIKNYIGVARDGTSSIRNTVGILNYSDGQIIGMQDGPNVIGHNEKAGIWITYPGGGSNPVVENNVIQYNFIGTNGTFAIGNEELGIWINQDSRNNQVTSNVVSGNGVFGIVIADGASLNTVTQNKIGVNLSGNASIPNGAGIWIRQAQDNTINSNVVSGNDIGMLIGTDIGIGQGLISKYNARPPLSPLGETFTSGNKIFGNVIGLSESGNTSLPSSIGIAIGENARNNMIGTAGGARNIVSGNTATLGYGIFLGTFTAKPTENSLPQFNTFVRNVVGLGSDLQTPFPNRIGFVVLGAKQNVIGGESGNLANIIVSNTEEGINLVSESEANNFLNNYIGVLPPGFGTLSKGDRAYSNFSTNYGNGGDGIFISNGSSQNTFGGTNTSSGLVIANNGGNGITLSPTAGNGNRIGTNSIFGNTGNSVDLGGDGFTPNDFRDADVGPNNLQNYPDLVSYQINVSGDLIVSFIVDSAPENSVYGINGIRAEFFKADNSGEGERFLGFANYTVADFNNGSPNVKIVNLGNAAALGFNPGDVLTSTATDADGNTSEFTPAFAPTAANVTVSGRVFANNSGLPRAIVVMTDLNGIQRTAQTNSFGYYNFEHVAAGETYVFDVRAKQYSFDPQVVNINETLIDLNFSAQTNNYRKLLK